MAKKEAKKSKAVNYKLTHSNMGDKVILRPIVSTGKKIYDNLLAKGYKIEEV